MNSMENRSTALDPMTEFDTSSLEVMVASTLGYAGPLEPKTVWQDEVVPAAKQCEDVGLMTKLERLRTLAETAGQVALTLGRRVRTPDAEWFLDQKRRLERKIRIVSFLSRWRGRLQ